MNVRCYRCGWSFTLGRDMIEAALTTASASGAKHHDERCPRCRQMLKISMDQIRRAAPPGWTPPKPEAQPTTESQAESGDATPPEGPSEVMAMRKTDASEAHEPREEAKPKTKPPPRKRTKVKKATTEKSRSKSQ